MYKLFIALLIALLLCSIAGVIAGFWNGSIAQTAIAASMFMFSSFGLLGTEDNVKR